MPFKFPPGQALQPVTLGAKSQTLYARHRRRRFGATRCTRSGLSAINMGGSFVLVTLKAEKIAQFWDKTTQSFRNAAQLSDVSDFGKIWLTKEQLHKWQKVAIIHPSSVINRQLDQVGPIFQA